ncbi:MAG TPA: hypothetical protein VGF62_10645, partial [Rhizomicrobium sp.]
MNVVCRHFGACGGCAWQDVPLEVYRERKRDLIADALARHGIVDPPLKEIVAVPPRSRRRATLRLQKTDGKTRLGFHAPRSHTLVDIRECHVLTPGLFGLAQGVREAFSRLLHEGESADLYFVQAENGFDLAVGWTRKAGSELVAQIAVAAQMLGLVRVTSGGDLLYETAAPEVQFGKARVKLPPNAFLQPTREGEALLQGRAAEAVGRARHIADLFAGCGTFTLPLAEKAQVHAVDADRTMLDALAAGARATPGLKPVSTERRDLFKHPLTAAELGRFDAVMLDPPRAG